jgi:hypothetical protein
VGFSINYRSTRPVTAEEAKVIDEAADGLSQGRSWLSSEPVFFARLDDGHLAGSSKPNFQPHPDDAAEAAKSGLPDGTSLDVLEILRLLSRDHGVDWELSHDYSDGPIGFIRAGITDPEVANQLTAFADLGDIIADELGNLGLDELN